MNAILLVAVGGAAGATARFLIAEWSSRHFAASFPFGTLLVNLIGCLLIGFLYFWLVNRFSLDAALRAFLIVGFLGAFTTFSAFSIENLIMIEQGRWLAAGIYVTLSVLGCLAASVVGMLLARSL